MSLVENVDILGRLQAQARLQVAVRGTDHHIYELLPALQGKGFTRIPRPADADLFFDMEGDPLYDGGLEYLFGVHVGSPESGEFHAFWGHDRASEKRALEDFLHFVTGHLAEHPDTHIYHYNHYEVTAVRRLAMAHATREAVVDDLLRRRKFAGSSEGGARGSVGQRAQVFAQEHRALLHAQARRRGCHCR